MLEPYPQHASKLAIRTAIAVVFTIYGNNAPNPEIGSQSDVLCWLIVLLLTVATRRKYAKAELGGIYNDWKRYSVSSWGILWTVATCISLSLWYTAEYGSVTLYPMLLPLLLKYSTNPSQQHATSTSKNSTFVIKTFNNVIVITIVSLFQSLVLSNWEIHTRWLAMPVMAALFLTYTLFIRGGNGQSNDRTAGVNFMRNGPALSWRIIIILVASVGLKAVVHGDAPILDPWSIPYGCFKAISWYYTALLAEQTSWMIAPAIATFSMIIGHDLLLESSMLLHLSHLFATVIALSYLHHVLFSNTKSKAVLWGLGLGSMVMVLNLLILSRAQSMIASQPSSNTAQHPIEILVQSARISHTTSLEQQSRSYESAHQEYRRRYEIEPPPGFQGWYNYAVELQSPIIDDYDTIMNSITPFLKLSGEEVVRAMNEIIKTPDVELWKCKFSSYSADLSCSHPTRKNDRHISSSLGHILGEFYGVLPDVDFLVNHLDEPRILLPTSESYDKYDSNKSVAVVDLAQQSTWEIISQNCAENHVQDVADRNLDVGSTLVFLNNSSSAGDLCQHPKYSHMHGMLSSPTSFKLIKGLVPVLSTGSLSTMGDILLPSPAYSEAQFEYQESQDMPWASKKNELFWTGSTTGGYVGQETTWSHFHRQRFVSLAQTFRTWTTSTPSRNSKVNNGDGIGMFDWLVSYIVNKKLFNVSFTKIFQCDSQACADQKSVFSMSPISPASRIYKSRLTFDLDGNGISGRFYSLLASRSFPLKQTILREWHDDRLVPWDHYVPISLGMEELQDVVWYFTVDARGKELAREIAEEGRVWFGKAMREVDRGLYVYRLMLELARLQDPMRGPMK